MTLESKSGQNIEEELLIREGKYLDRHNLTMSALSEASRSYSAKISSPELGSDINEALAVYGTLKAMVVQPRIKKNVRGLMDSKNYLNRLKEGEKAILVMAVGTSVDYYLGCTKRGQLTADHMMKELSVQNEILATIN